VNSSPQAPSDGYRPPRPGRPWSELLEHAGEVPPAQPGRRLGRGLTARLAEELPGFAVRTGEDGLSWIAGRMALGGIGVALAAASYPWMLVHRFGAPAVLLLRVSSAGELQVDVRQSTGERLTRGALAVAAAAARAGRRLAQPTLAPPPRGGFGTPEAEPLSDAELEGEIAERAGWELSWEPTGPVGARWFGFDDPLGPWMLLQLAAPGLGVTWPELAWRVEAGPSWAAVSIHPGEGRAPTRRLLAAVDWLEELGGGLTPLTEP
jgi:hypothetical protein